MRKTEIGSSVEGNRLVLRCKKFNPKPPKFDNNLQTILYRIKMAINARAMICKCYPKLVPIFKQTSLLCIDDSIFGNVISVHSFDVIPSESVKPDSHRHRCQQIETNANSIAEIIIDFQHNKKVIKPI